MRTKSNHKIVETLTLTDHATGTSMKSGGVKLFLGPNSPLCFFE